ncbi:hypothetical protein C4577_05335 [Candidatus Parcubacteria bacterium]|nr:MAG: hypothetical protein C4577_05335 [Candidatus Parcubacteria bacterium]
MSKKRKTRKEKEVSELRKKLISAQKKNQSENYKLNEPLTSSLKSDTEKETKKTYSPLSLNNISFKKVAVARDFSYVFQDMRKTLIITLLILFAQAILLVLSQKNLINLSF